MDANEFRKDHNDDTRSCEGSTECTGWIPTQWDLDNPDITEESEFVPPQVSFPPTPPPPPAAHQATPQNGHKASCSPASQATAPSSCGGDTLGHLSFSPADVQPSTKAGAQKIIPRGLFYNVTSHPRVCTYN